MLDSEDGEGDRQLEASLEELFDLKATAAAVEADDDGEEEDAAMVVAVAVDEKVGIGLERERSALVQQEFQSTPSLSC